MRILGITETCDLGSLYLRLIGEGHEVRVTVSEPLAAGTMAGMVPRAENWRDELPWVREAGREGVILFEATGFGALQDELRRAGYNVIGIFHGHEHPTPMIYRAEGHDLFKPIASYMGGFVVAKVTDEAFEVVLARAYGDRGDVVFTNAFSKPLGTAP